jgi:hypothetical protein
MNNSDVASSTLTTQELPDNMKTEESPSSSQEQPEPTLADVIKLMHGIKKSWEKN